MKTQFELQQMANEQIAAAQRKWQREMLADYGNMYKSKSDREKPKLVGKASALSGIYGDSEATMDDLSAHTDATRAGMKVALENMWFTDDLKGCKA